MLQNIKIDIIYYKSDTDFEMEFNLGGCCRMRLLTGKSFDEKTTIHCLARAVSRSKVIMVVGPLFGPNGIINIVSAAIGSKTETINKAEYKITCAQEIEIIKDSTPLITPEGFFGGCIIENGPQTMILLSDSKNIRKPIMKTLIHPYIEKLYTSENKTVHTLETTEEKIEPISDSLALTGDVESIESAVINPEFINQGSSDAIELPKSYKHAEDSFLKSTESIENILPESYNPPPKSRYKHAEIEPEPEIESIPEIEPKLETESNIEPQPILNLKDNVDTEIEEKDEIIEEPEINKVSNNYITFEIDETIDEDESDFLFQNNETNLDENSDSDSLVEATNNDFQDIELFVEPNKLTRRKAKLLNHFYARTDDNEPLSAEYDENFTKKPLSLKPPILVLAMLLLVVVTLLCYCIFYVPTRYGVSTMQYINEIFSTLFR